MGERERGELNTLNARVKSQFLSTASICKVKKVSVITALPVSKKLIILNKGLKLPLGCGRQWIKEENRREAKRIEENRRELKRIDEN